MAGFVIGGLYASRQKDGAFRIVKVLAAGEGTVHLRLYAETFGQPPQSASSAQLSLGTAAGGTFGIGCYPVSEEGFLRTEKTLLAREPVAEAELEGYRMWIADQRRQRTGGHDAD
jgi:hypothetical protein